MITAIDHIIIAVKNLKKAEANYKLLLGRSPVWRGTHKHLGTENSLFIFKNTYLELLAQKGDGMGAELIKNTLKEKGEGLFGLALKTKDIEHAAQKLQEHNCIVGPPFEGKGENNKDGSVRTWKNLFLTDKITRGIFSFLIEHKNGSLPKVDKYEPSIINNLDHVVMTTSDPDGFINTYRDIYKIRLALDKYVKSLKSRVLFFKLSQTTLEVVVTEKATSIQDSLWGLAWGVESIQETRSRLISQGIKVSPIKKGVKERTLVATVKSNTHDVPTLLIEHH
ncbi:VOC family protein [Hellea sp.]|nr:VOC family protein [Hellea sp.]MDC1088179.1 VOC family protein [Hellea sp.]